jgi:hypothetical protein
MHKEKIKIKRIPDLRIELLKYVAEGYIDKDDLLVACLTYMSHHDVVEMLMMNDFEQAVQVFEMETYK